MLSAWAFPLARDAINHLDDHGFPHFWQFFSTSEDVVARLEVSLDGDAAPQRGDHFTFLDPKPPHLPLTHQPKEKDIDKRVKGMHGSAI